jgi:hypothetical protein
MTRWAAWLLTLAGGTGVCLALYALVGQEIVGKSARANAASAPYAAGANGPRAGGSDRLGSDQRRLTYSFRYRDTHFTVLNTDPYATVGTVPWTWVAADVGRAIQKIVTALEEGATGVEDESRMRDLAYLSMARTYYSSSIKLDPESNAPTVNSEKLSAAVKRTLGENEVHRTCHPRRRMLAHRGPVEQGWASAAESRLPCPPSSMARANDP